MATISTLCLDSRRASIRIISELRLIYSFLGLFTAQNNDRLLSLLAGQIWTDDCLRHNWRAHGNTLEEL